MFSPLPEIDPDKLSEDIRTALRNPGGTTEMRAVLARSLQMLERCRATAESEAMYHQLVDTVGQVRTVRDLKLEHIGRTIEIDVLAIQQVKTAAGMVLFQTHATPRVARTETIEIALIDADKNSAMFIDKAWLDIEKWTEEFDLDFPCRLLPVDTMPQGKIAHEPEEKTA